MRNGALGDTQCGIKGRGHRKHRAVLIDQMTCVNSPIASHPTHHVSHYLAGSLFRQQADAMHLSSESPPISELTAVSHEWYVFTPIPY